MGVVRDATSGDGASIAELSGGALGGSTLSFQILSQLVRAAASDRAVLLTGEVGTAKAALARVVHRASPRVARRMVALGCSAFALDALDIDLDGREALGSAHFVQSRAARSATGGRTTGGTRSSSRSRTTATRDSGSSLLRDLEGGTLLLEEVGEVPHSVQLELLRRATCANQSRSASVRLVMTSSLGSQQDRCRSLLCPQLAELCEEVYIPPLRERLDDIPALVEHALRRTARAPGDSPRQIAAEAMDALMRCSWPRNVRQLQSTVLAAASIPVDRTIERGDFPDATLREAGYACTSLKWKDWQRVALEQLNKEYLESVLRSHDWRVREAAEHAGIERESFYRLMKRYRVVAI